MSSVIIIPIIMRRIEKNIIMIFGIRKEMEEEGTYFCSNVVQHGIRSCCCCCCRKNFLILGFFFSSWLSSRRRWNGTVIVMEWHTLYLFSSKKEKNTKWLWYIDWVVCFSFLLSYQNQKSESKSVSKTMFLLLSFWGEYLRFFAFVRFPMYRLFVSLNKICFFH